MAKMTKKQIKDVAKTCEKFQRHMQALVDDNNSGITGVSITVGNQTVKVAEKKAKQSDGS